ncbi:MAG: OmpA family protein [Candidatus Tectomicrobia bacterium]|nr:OmpA family protein [Candidatus Tectomicrobia bacterium]
MQTRKLYTMALLLLASVYAHSTVNAQQVEPAANSQPPAATPQLQEQQRHSEGSKRLQKDMEPVDGEQSRLEWIKKSIESLEEQGKKQLQEWLQKDTVQDTLIEVEQVNDELQRLNQEQEKIEKEMKATQKSISLFQSSLADTASSCSDLLEEAKLKFTQENHSMEAWFYHVFECKECCAPLLVDIMDIHSSYVVEQPHVLILFAFDTYTLNKKYKHDLDTLMQQYDKANDQILLIGRASKIGPKDYNVSLSGKRVGEIKDYLMDQFSVEESQIRYFYFGADPPQLTVEHAERYGVIDRDTMLIDRKINNTPEDKINQSVVIIIYKPENASKAFDATPDHLYRREPPEGLSPKPAQAVERPEATDNLTKSALQSSASVETSDPASPTQAVGMGLVIGLQTGPYVSFGQDIAKVGLDAGLDILVGQSEGVVASLRRLMNSEDAVLGMVQADVMRFLSSSPDPELERLSRRLRMLLPLFNLDVHLFAHKEIKRPEDLDGKRVILGLPGSDSWLTAKNLLRLFEIEPAELIDDLSLLDAVGWVLTGQADAMFYVASKPAEFFTNIHKLQHDPQFSHLVPEAHFVPLHQKPLLKEYVTSTIGPEDYPWMSATVPTIAVKVVLISRNFSNLSTPFNRLRCEQIETLGQAIQDQFADLKRTGHPKWQDVDLKHPLTLWKRGACN